jgi:hypothetical protein
LICDFSLKAAGILTAFAVAIATLGIPLPVPAIKDIAEAFPCMDCGCGCVNADMCWRQCCCYTNSQKLAWAAKHKVQVPEFVLEQVAAEIDTDPAELAQVKPCCRQRVLTAKSASCCDRQSGSCPEARPQNPPAIPGVLAIHALKCQGFSLSISLLPPSVPTDEIGTELPLVPGEQVAIAGSESYQPPFFDAVVPPPELAVL